MNLEDIPPVFIPISEKDTQDSYVYKNILTPVAVKMYSDCDEECLAEYAALQNILAEHDLDMDLSGEYLYRWEVFSRLAVSILELPDQSYPASFIGAGENYKEEIRITTPKYVTWENFRDVLKSDDPNILSKDLSQTIVGILGEFMYEISGDEAIDFAEFIPENTIVSGIQDRVMGIIITDVSSSIPRFVRNNAINFSF